MNTPLTALFQTAFGDSPVAPLRPAARRRRKLWELPSRCHCPLIGTCLPVKEMRKLTGRAGFHQCDMSDYTLHTAVVGSCDTRTELAELVQRYFEKRYAAAVSRFAGARDEEGVLALWREAVASGDDIAGALWATWSHADLSEEGSKCIYGDIHMLSHQIGASVRADLRQLEHLKRENARLRDEAQALRIGLTGAQREKAKAVADLQRRLDEAEQRASLLGAREVELTMARKAARDYATLVERSEKLAERAELLEERNAANARRAEELARELNETQDSLAAAESALELALGIGECAGVAGNAACGRACPAEAALTGRCVLCIGGKTNLVDGYRRLVETQGGRFLHHDGGQEESLHRIDAAVSAADAVVCQSGCISHAAYYRLKEACKKLGKPCVFVQSPGVASFARGLATIGGATNAIRISQLSS